MPRHIPPTGVVPGTHGQTPPGAKQTVPATHTQTYGVALTLRVSAALACGSLTLSRSGFAFVRSLGSGVRCAHFCPRGAALRCRLYRHCRFAWDSHARCARCVRPGFARCARSLSRPRYTLGLISFRCAVPRSSFAALVYGRSSASCMSLAALALFGLLIDSLTLRVS